MSRDGYCMVLIARRLVSTLSLILVRLLTRKTRSTKTNINIDTYTTYMRVAFLFYSAFLALDTDILPLINSLDKR